MHGRDAGEMNWEAIGGTWGVATSRLNERRLPSDGFTSKLLQQTVEIIGDDENKNGQLLGNYVLKYFDDMWSHFQSLIGGLNDGARLHSIVGNSTFYNVLVPVEQVYAEMLSQLGFSNVVCVPVSGIPWEQERVCNDGAASQVERFAVSASSVANLSKTALSPLAETRGEKFRLPHASAQPIAFQV